MFKLYWIREDEQGSFDMGSYDSPADAEAAIPAAEAELIDQCGEDYQKAEIKAGRSCGSKEFFKFMRISLDTYAC
jgi:hypothetical protein